MAVGVVAIKPVVAAFELQTDLLLHNSRATFALGGRQLLLPEVLRLHDVIVNRDDQGEVFLGGRDVAHDVQASS